jgi:type III secretion protein V
MPLEKALTTYSILTIGDGLVSQIPSLLISITAAIIVTRVSSEESGGGLGGEIGRQLLGQPKALLIGAALLVLIGLVPGFPTPLFLVMALIFGALGYSMSQQRRRVMSVPSREWRLPCSKRKEHQKTRNRRGVLGCRAVDDRDLSGHRAGASTNTI